MKKIVGVNFLEEHREYGKLLGIDINHIIVDKHDWEDIITFFMNYRNLVDELGKQRNLIFEDEKDNN